uniref:Uncharacterized protein n=1 Tax=Glossina austeni TaxID=7395 RepID=A0A1A9UTF3_GLOAU
MTKNKERTKQKNQREISPIFPKNNCNKTFVIVPIVFYAIESGNKVTCRTANESAKGLQHGVTHSEGLFTMLSFSVLLMKFLIAETFNPNGLKARQPTDKHKTIQTGGLTRHAINQTK